MSFKDLTEEQQYEVLKERRNKNEAFKAAEKALFKKLEKKFSDPRPDSGSSSGSQPNEFGRKPTTKINPKAIRFVQAERDSLTSRKDSLVRDSSEMIIERLGSLKYANDTMLIRAAVLSLVDMPDAQLIEFMKQAQRNMM